MRAKAADEVRFFNVSLVNANVMSVPRFPQPQRLVGELIHSIEAASPRFAWVQFLFRRADYSAVLVDLKNDMQEAAEQIKTPKKGLISGTEYDRAELRRDWYKKVGDRMKKADSLVNAPQVLLAIQGMWVGDPNLLSSLPFKDCHDDHDKLGVFTYRNPWMLVELVNRRMVTDISGYFRRYASSRLEPPSMLMTQEEIPYYVHLPILRQTENLTSIEDWVQYSPQAPGGVVEGAKPKSPAVRARVARLAGVPKIEEPLKENDTERLGILPSLTVRGFEVLFDGGKTEILLSSRSESDMPEYATTIYSVYGEFPIEPSPDMPPFLKELPEIVGLTRPPRPSRWQKIGRWGSRLRRSKK